MPPGVIKGPSAWHGSSIKFSKDWIRPFSSGELCELDTAMREIKARGLDIVNILKKDFTLPTLGPIFEKIRFDLLNKRGFILMRGIPVEDYTIEEISIIYYGIGTHFGVALPQNAKGHLLGHIKDVGLNSSDPNVRIYQTNERQTYHTDSCDLVFLLCLRPAMAGGLSSIVSSVTIYNEILRLRPDLLNILFNPIETDRRGEVPENAQGYYLMPIFNWFSGKLSTLYTRRYIESARRFSDVPPISKMQLESLDLFDQIANDPSIRLDMEFQPGDIQVLHNHQILHDRTSYKDWPELNRRRHLLRLWICPPDGRSLPDTYLDRYGSIEIGSLLRGGTRVFGQVRNVPLEAE